MTRETLQTVILTAVLLIVGYAVRTLYMLNPVVFVLGSVCIALTFGMAYFVARDLRRKPNPLGSFMLEFPTSRNAASVATRIEYDEENRTLYVFHIREKKDSCIEWGTNGRKETGGTIETSLRLHTKVTDIAPHRANAIRDRILREGITDSNKITGLVQAAKS